MPKRILSGVVVSSNSNKTITVDVTRRIKHKLYKKIIRQTKLYRKKHDEYWRDFKMKAEIYEENYKKMSENLPKYAKRKRGIGRNKRKKKIESRIPEGNSRGEKEGKLMDEGKPDPGNARSAWAGRMSRIQNAESIQKPKLNHRPAHKSKGKVGLSGGSMHNCEE